MRFYYISMLRIFSGVPLFKNLIINSSAYSVKALPAIGNNHTELLLMLGEWNDTHTHIIIST